MTYRLIVSDMDGTLLRSDHTISEYTREVIHDISDRGIDFMLATGRIFGGASHFAKELGLNTPILACNGALIKDMEGKVFSKRPIAPESLVRVFDLLTRNQCYFHFYGEENFYTRKFWDEWTTFYDFNKKLPEKDRFPMIEVPRPSDIIPKDQILKVLVHCEGETNRRNLFQQLSEIPHISITSSWSNSFDICAEQVNKSSAIAQYAVKQGISPAEIVCFGDNCNDMDMLQYAGLSIAVGNSVPELKEIAKIVTETNDQDGVARAIQRYCLQQ